MTPNIYDAFYDFLDNFCIPKIDKILIGNQNRYVLPTEDNFALIFIVMENRRGTNVNSYSDNIVSIDVSQRGLIKIDFYGQDSREQAFSISNLFLSVEGIDFLNNFGISPHYADSIRDRTIVDENNEYVISYTLSLHFGYTAGVERQTETFNEIKIKIMQELQ